MPPRLSMMLVLLAWLAQATADYPLEIIPLEHQTVEQMLPLLQPFVEPGGAVTGMNSQLIIRTSPENLRQLRAIIRKFDRAPRQLRIAVRQGGATHLQRRSMGAEGTVEWERGSVTIGRPGEGMDIYMDDRNRSYSTDAERYIRATEGMPAFIQSGLSVPLITGGIDPWGRPWVQQQYHDATSGFYVTPWISGDRVTLEISPFSSRPTGNGRSFRVQDIETRITGRLGEWIPIGGTELRRSGSERGIISYGTGSARSQQPVEVKVELAP